MRVMIFAVYEIKKKLRLPCKYGPLFWLASFFWYIYTRVSWWFTSEFNGSLFSWYQLRWGRICLGGSKFEIWRHFVCPKIQLGKLVFIRLRQVSDLFGGLVWYSNITWNHNQFDLIWNLLYVGVACIRVVSGSNLAHDFLIGFSSQSE